jgi:hypothetical protein
MGKVDACFDDHWGNLAIQWPWQSPQLLIGLGQGAVAFCSKPCMIHHASEKRPFLLAIAQMV